MRILRGKSNLEVSYRGFAWFVVGVVLATFLGGAVRTVLSSDRVHQRIVTELKSRFPKQEFQIGRTEVLLAQGLWPGLGLRLRDVRFRQETCDKLSFDLVVPQVDLPVDMLSLRKGRLRLGRVELTGGRLHFDYKPCPQAPPTTATATAPEPVPGPSDPATPRKPWLAAETLDWRKAGQSADALELRDFTVTFEPQETWKLLVRRMSLDLDDELSAQGVLEVQKSLPFGTLSHLVEVDAHGADQILQWGVRADYKEGGVQLRGSADLHSGAGVMQVTVRQLPLKDLMSELHQIGVVDREMALKTTWLSCGLKWEGQIHRPKDMPISVRTCRIEGGYGRADLDAADFWPGQTEWLKVPARLKGERLQVQPVLEALGRKVLPAVMPKLGVWTGEISYGGLNAWSLDGELEGAEVTFSNRSIRGKQVLEKMHTVLSRAGERIEGKVDALVLQGGEFQGNIGFALTEDWRNGNFAVEIHKLRVHPSIQNLLVGGTIGNVQVDGRGSLMQGELSQWNGRIALENV
ncbi:MAG TPA: hypothetical protein PKC28_10770, partial [Bdellovibrionales bacterium]|nr:hypothetical protein [Bdellovibrionales bacterium]